MRHLNNNNHYQALDQDPTSAFSKNVCRSLEKAFEVGLIDQELKYALKPKNPKPGRFYTLPNLHKQFDTIPTARHIVSANGSVTERLSLFIDHHIKPHVLSLPSYVQDDMDFLRKIESVNANGPLPPNMVLWMCQHRVPIFQLKKVSVAVASFLQDKFTNEQLDAFCDFMNIVLTHNNFTFDGKHFKQVFGTSMAACRHQNGT